MPDVTPIYGLPYLLPGDAPDLAAATQGLAADTETELARIDDAAAAHAALPPSTAHAAETQRLGCALRRVANQVVATASGTALSWDTEDTDSGGFYTSGTDIVIPAGAGGIYGISAFIQSGSLSGICLVQIGFTSTVTGHASLYRFYHNESFGSASAITRLAAGDTVNVTVVHNSGANRNYVGSVELWKVAA